MSDRFVRSNVEPEIQNWLCPDDIRTFLLAENLEAAIAFSKQNLSYDEKKFWGRYYNLYESAEAIPHPSGAFEGNAPVRKEKVLIINPQTRLITQTHEHKTEYWFAITDNVSFSAGVHLDRMTYQTMKKGEIAVIPAGTFHRIENNSDETSLLYEIQIGFCHEQDVKRYEG